MNKAVPVNAVPVIETQHISKRFGATVALEGVSLEIRQGEFHAIVGENGAGKSTLMKILSGIVAAFEGTLHVRGAAARFTRPRDAEAAGISIIHQELNLVEELTAAANIFLGRELRGRWGLLDDRAMEREAGRLLAQLECDIPPHRLVRELRVGDQQLVEIAKALSLDTSILIMDEPTSALTETEVARLFRVIERLKRQGVTILYISHKLDEVFRLSDRITVLRDGRLVATLPRDEVTPREIVHLMVGRELENAIVAERPVPGDVVLSVQRLSLPWRGHARQWRLRDVSFTLRRGEVLGIAGLMGAGRTELLEALFGTSRERPEGRIVLEGEPVNFAHPADARAAGIALVTEDRKRLGLFANLDVGSNITVCTLREVRRGLLLNRKQERRIAVDSIGNLRIKAAGPDAPMASLSGGNQQKCIIARWLRTRPRVLLLDDPTRGIDVGAKAEIYRLIDELCREGLGIIVTSSELPELLTLCDRILVLCEGRVTGEFARGDFSEQRLMEAATCRE